MALGIHSLIVLAALLAAPAPHAADPLAQPPHGAESLARPAQDGEAGSIGLLLLGLLAVGGLLLVRRRD